MKIIRKIKPEFLDKRGGITRLYDQKTNIKSALLITSKKGTVRSNHYHKKDTHYVYMISGKMRYTVKDMSKKRARKQSVILKTGDMVFTPPMMAHAMEFLEDSVFLALTTRKRDQKSYENDVVRLELV